MTNNNQLRNNDLSGITTKMLHFHKTQQTIHITQNITNIRIYSNIFGYPNNSQ